MENQKKDNVLNFPGLSHPIFNGELRDNMVNRAATILDGDNTKSEAVVDGLEKVICSHILLFVRRAGMKIGQHFAGKVLK